MQAVDYSNIFLLGQIETDLDVKRFRFAVKHEMCSMKNEQRLDLLQFR